MYNKCKIPSVYESDLYAASGFYGDCECGGKYYPIWYLEYKKIVNKKKMKWAVSHLECSICGNKQAVDDTYDGEWIDAEIVKKSD